MTVVTLQLLNGSRHTTTAPPNGRCKSLAQQLGVSIGVPAWAQAFYYNGRAVALTSSLEESGIVDGCVVHVVLRLRAGKGGFGANLRSAGKKLKGSISNFDSCRDLVTGERIRHLNQRKQLEGWKEGQKADPSAVMHELSKKELSQINRKDKQEAREEEERKAQPTDAQIRQKELEARMDQFTKSLTSTQQSAQNAVFAAVASRKRPREELEGGSAAAAATTTTTVSPTMDGSASAASSTMEDVPPAKRPATGLHTGLSDDEDESESD